MRPLLHPTLVNGRSGGPAVYVETLFEKRAILFGLCDITALPPGSCCVNGCRSWPGDRFMSASIGVAHGMIWERRTSSIFSTTSSWMPWGEAGTPAAISFADADAVIAIDTIDERAGFSLWTREDLTQHRLLRPD